MAEAQPSGGSSLAKPKPKCCKTCRVSYGHNIFKLLSCGHYYCKECIFSMTRVNNNQEEVVVCLCGYPTHLNPSPRDFCGLPNPQADASRESHALDVEPETGRQADKRGASPGPGNAGQSDAEPAQDDDDYTYESTEEVARAVGKLTAEQIDSVGASNVLSRHSVPKAEGNQPNTFVPFTRPTLFEMIPMEQSGMNRSNFNEQRNNHYVPDTVERVTKEQLKLIEKLRFLTNKNYCDDRWMFTSFFHDERRNIHRNLLDIQREELFLRPQNCSLNRFIGHDQSHNYLPVYGLDVLRDIKGFLGEMRYEDGGEDHIFNLCSVLIFQRYQEFLAKTANPNVGQEARRMPTAVMLMQILTSNNNFRPTASTEHTATQTEWCDVEERSAEAPSDRQDEASKAPKPEGSFRSGIQLNDGMESGARSRENSFSVIQYASSRTYYNRQMALYGNRFNLTLRDLSNIYYMDFQINGLNAGRIIIETFPSLMPLMSANFAVLCCGRFPISYRGCKIFHCWMGQSVVSGDIELNLGGGERYVLNEEFFVPDDYSLPGVRGTIGFRRIPRIPRSYKGKVSSQFRILLSYQPKITGQFGYVLSGIEFVDRISQLGDGRGNPHQRVIISACGKLDF